MFFFYTLEKVEICPLARLLQHWFWHVLLQQSQYSTSFSSSGSSIMIVYPSSQINVGEICATFTHFQANFASMIIYLEFQFCQKVVWIYLLNIFWKFEKDLSMLTCWILIFKLVLESSFLLRFFSVWLFTPNSVLEHLALCPELRFTPFGGLGRIPFWNVWLYKS